MIRRVYGLQLGGFTTRRKMSWIKLTYNSSALRWGAVFRRLYIHWMNYPCGCFWNYQRCALGEVRGNVSTYLRLWVNLIAGCYNWLYSSIIAPSTWWQVKMLPRMLKYRTTSGSCKALYKRLLPTYSKSWRENLCPGKAAASSEIRAKEKLCWMEREDCSAEFLFISETHWKSGLQTDIQAFKNPYTSKLKRASQRIWNLVRWYFVQAKCVPTALCTAQW